MATIALYKNKVNGIGSLIDNIIKSSNSLDNKILLSRAEHAKYTRFWNEIQRKAESQM